MANTKHASPKIPTVDLSHFNHGGDISSRKKVIDTISDACKHLGVFQIENHGLSLDICNRLMELSKTYFNYPEKEKNGFTFVDYFKSGNGYYNRPIDKDHDFEYILMTAPKTPFNGVPRIPDEYKKTYKEAYKHFLKMAHILEEIINDCLGLHPKVLKNYNNDRSLDCMLAMNYPPLDKTGIIGHFEHQDCNMFTIVLEDEVCGLEVFINRKWIPIKPVNGKLVVIIGDLIQVLSNKKFRSVTHRALRHKGKNRHAIDFCYNVGGEKWVEPLHQLTKDIGVKPKYRGFKYYDYIDLKKKDERFNLTYYEI